MSKCEHAAAWFRVPGAQTKVHKDECTRCFDDAFAPEGLDVCMTCFNAGCRAQGHAEAHARLAGHPLVLNVRCRRVPREAEAEAEGAGLTKVAVGVEGGAAFEAPEVVTESSLRCYECAGGEVDPASVPGLAEAVEAVLAATSAADASMPKPWENKLEACEHALMLQQTEDAPMLATKSLAHCESCDVSDNLWLCLTCGALGCGRKLWDGSGGNGHGLSHHEATGHPLVCKMGTISPEGTADVHCYLCDEMRLNPMLVEHLGHFGIAVSDQVRSGKTMAELELEANKAMNWNLVLGDDGKEAELLFGPGVQGFKNLGNTCYLNSVLQAAMNVPEFVEAYRARGREHAAQCRSLRPADCFLCQMAKLAEAMGSGRYSARPSEEDEEEAAAAAGGRHRELQPGVSPHMLRSILVKDHAEFATNRQQDAFEFFQYLVQQLQQRGRGPGVDPTGVFEFKLEQRVECTECHRVRYKTEKAQELSLPIPVSDDARRRVAEAVAAKHEQDERERAQKEEAAAGAAGATAGAKRKQADGPEDGADGDGGQKEEAAKAAEKEKERKRRRRDADLATEEKSLEVPFADCLRAWSQPEAVDSYQCSHCNKRVSATKTTRIASFPETLVVQMRRFVFDDWVPRKLGATVQVGDAAHDLEALRARGLQDGEEEMPSEAAAAAPAADEGIVSGLMAMGFPRVRCEKAALAVDNAGIGPASEWLFAHMDDPDIDEPAPAPAAAPAAAAAPVDEMAVMQLMSMGFDVERCKYALGEVGGSVDRAVDWLFSHAGEPLPEPGAAAAPAAAAAAAEAPEDDGRPARYELASVVTHLGASVHLGHYVAHVKLPDGRWALFNDTKVSAAPTEPAKHGYLYFFRRVKE